MRLSLPHQGRQRAEGPREERARVDVDRRVRPQLQHRRSADAEDRQEREGRLPWLLAPEGQDEDGSSGENKGQV